MQLTHRNLWLNAAMFGWHAGVSDRDVYLHTLPMFHCNGWGMPFALTGMGAQQVVLRKVDGDRDPAPGRAPRRHAAVRRPGRGGRHPRRRRALGRAGPRAATAPAWSSPAPRRPPGSIERMETELGWEFIQIYGLTETAPLLTMNRSRPEWDDLDAGRAGRPARAGRCADAGRHACRSTDQGEVLARSNVVLEGYWEQPEASAEALDDGWFHTGDGGTFEDGYLTISDRKKDVIISGGENVSSIEVEDALHSHPAVAEVAVIGVPDEKWGETVKALVVLAPGSDADERELIDHCRQPAGPLQVPDVGRAPRRAAPHGDGQAPEVQAAGALLGGAGPPGELT